MSISVGILGATGYTGFELVRLLYNHPDVAISYCSSRQYNGKQISDILSSLRGYLDIQLEEFDAEKVRQRCDVVFSCLPHGLSMDFVPQVLDSTRVVDLSADFRLRDISVYTRWYKEHTSPGLIEKAVYGLCEVYREEITGARLVANPGCYPTATLLGLMPFVSYIKPDTPIFIDAKSGVSGAGKKLNQTTAFMNMQENSFAYSPLTHRHGYEIEYILKNFTKKSYDINFVPHLLPISRGMLCSIYLQLDNKIDATKILTDYYNSQKFVRIRTNPPTIKDTAGTNFCDIFVALKGQNLFINTSIDNLSRGASSQAVVNANIMCGLDEGLGV